MSHPGMTRSPGAVPGATALRVAVTLCLLSAGAGCDGDARKARDVPGTVERAVDSDLITVDTTVAVKDLAARPVGINTNYLLDDDASRPGALPLKDAMASLGVKYLRYPGGEKSDSYLWSVPPFDRSVPTLARTGPWEWPSGDGTLVQPDGRTFWASPLDFDEFVSVAKSVGGEPVLVVCFDSMYKAATAGGTAPTRQQLLDTAREWVRYANKTKLYGIKYWELGNETYLNHYNGSASATTYANDLIEFSQVMKAVDPTLLIGANGSGSAWWQTVLSIAGPSIDFLAIHEYPAWNWKSYEYYRTSSPNLVWEITTATNAINTHAPVADRSRLFIAVTEANSADWSTGGWPHVNTQGHAVVLFEQLGRELSHPRVRFTQVWNTRWVNNGSAPPELWDALTPTNGLHASGRVVSIWNTYLLEKLVSSTSTAMVRTFTSHSPGTRRANVFLINKDTVARSAGVTVRPGVAAQSATRWTLAGTGSEDTQPIWSQGSNVSVSNNQLSVTLPPVSITVVSLRDVGTVLPNLLSNPGFEQGVASWTNWGNISALPSNAHGGVYALRTGTAGGGAGQTLTTLTPGTAYALRGWGRVGAAGETGWLGVTLTHTSGAKTEDGVSYTETAYVQKGFTFTTPSDLESVTVWGWKGPGIGSYFYADDLELTRASP